MSNVRMKFPSHRRGSPRPAPAGRHRDALATIRILTGREDHAAAPGTPIHLVDAQAVAQLGSWKLDLASGAVAFSSEMRRIFGWGTADVQDLSCLAEAVHPDDRAKVGDWLARNAAMRPPASGCLFRLVMADGGIRMLYGRSALRAARNGARARICGTVQDITDQESGERTVGEVAHLFRDIFEHCVWGIFQTTPEGRYLTANPALARIYGFDGPEELLSKLTNIGGQLYVEPERRDEFIRLMHEKGVVTDFESAVRRRDGSVIWINETCREVRTTAGRLLYYEGTVEDITERKRREVELYAAKESAEVADRAKTEFLATMSHELRTPLNAVMGFAEIIRNESMGPVGVSIYRDYAGDIHDSGQHLLMLINDILDFVKADSGGLQLDWEMVELNGVIAGVARLLAAQAEAAGVTLAEQESSEPVFCRGEERRLRQILINLVGNSIKFTLAGGRIDIATDTTPDGQARITVRDTGIGMSPEDLGRIGEPFYQADSTLARKYEGTGLGLAISHRMVRLHNGTLKLESVVGKGTTATILLPREQNPLA
ncbi:MAG TPA: ATP-binding protein [Stellaceae bacterium]|nr:ATP-binding protein [Stellaceae bacterium]